MRFRTTDKTLERPRSVVRLACSALVALLLSASLAIGVFSQGDTQPKPKKSGKKTLDALGLDHPEVPRSEREERNALTREVSPQLPKAPRIAVERRNYIDDQVLGRIQQDRIPHAGLSTDLEFVRRIHLDLTGRIPEPEAIRKFLSDTNPKKRDQLIDELAAPERYQFQDQDPFVDRWTYWFSDLFGSNGGELGTAGRNIFYDYIRAVLRLNTPYDRFVREMLTASALTNWYSGPSNFLARFHVDDATGNQIHHEDSLDEIAVATSRILLGLNLECVSCHDGERHLEKINLWLTGVKREQLWRQAAFFGNLTIYRPPPRRQEFTLVENGPGYDAEAYPAPARRGYSVEADSAVRMPRWKADVHPAFLLTSERPKPGDDLRVAFSRMITEHPQFSKAIVNWIWAELMGVGIVDPPFDFDLARQDPKNPPPAPWTLQPTHPELLEALAKDFREHGHDLRYLIKLITKSSTYQLASRFDGEWKDSYARYFARRFVRRLTAEELFDAVSQATGLFPEIPISGTGIKVKYVMQTRSPEDIRGGELNEIWRFLGSFGQDNRSRTIKSLKGNMIQSSLMLNSNVIKERVKAKPGGRIRKLLDQEPPLGNDQLVEELFLAMLSRFPTPEEKEIAVSQVREYRTQGVEDLAWVLLNKLDFIFNY
jgi:Protein of unknown function (DUF1553)/Protein of unknown function (DUF1549)